MNKTFQKESQNPGLSYHDLVSYMKELRIHFKKGICSKYAMGKIYQGAEDYTYFSITPDQLKKIKLKFVIISEHKRNCFVICLSGQNKAVRKKYWNLLSEVEWNKYHLADSIENSLMIVDHTISKKPDFQDQKKIFVHLEKETLAFMKELSDILETLGRD